MSRAHRLNAFDLNIELLSALDEETRLDVSERWYTETAESSSMSQQETRSSRSAE